MKSYILVLLCLAILGVSSCLEDEPGYECDASTLAVVASTEIDGEPTCYLNGALIYDEQNDLLILQLYGARGFGTGERNIDASFPVPPQGFQFNESYAASSGVYSDSLLIKSGTLSLTKDNYPQDPSLLQYAGEFDLEFQNSDSSEVVHITGNFSLEKP